MVPKADSGTFLFLFLLVLSITEPLRPGRGGGGAGGAGPGRTAGRAPGVSPGRGRVAGAGQVWAVPLLCAFEQSRDAAEHRSPVPAAGILESLDLARESA